VHISFEGEIRGFFANALYDLYMICAVFYNIQSNMPASKAEEGPLADVVSVCSAIWDNTLC